MPSGNNLDFVPYPGQITISSFSKQFAKKVGPDVALAARENFVFGADPEVFIFNAEGKAVPPTMIPGDKQNPHKVRGGALQRDGFAAEFNINPAHDFATWNKNFDTVLAALQECLPEGYTWKAVPSVVFEEEIFEDAPDDYKILGCSPDWNAWTQDVNPPPFCEENPFLRCAGGHIHVGWGKNYSMDDALHLQNCFDLVKQLDWFLAGWSLKMDNDVTRRALYGNAGACRLKSYGVEYRTLSNFWITTKDRRLAVWNRLQLAIGAMNSGFLPDRAPEGFNDKLVEGINTGKFDPAFKKTCHFPLVTTESSYAKF